MPDWLLTALRSAWMSVRGVWRWFKRRAVADHGQVREGSAIVTEVSEFIGKAHPAYWVWSKEALASAPPFEELGEEWRELRPRLLMFANQHPSDEVQKLGNELAEAIEKLLLVPLMGPSPSPESVALYESATSLHGDANALCQELLKQIRDF